MSKTPTVKKPATKKPTAKKAKGAPKPVAAKPLSMMQAALRLLGATEQPMHVNDLIDQMAAKALWSSPAGKTPAATLSAALLRETAKGAASRVKKTGPNTFALKPQKGGA